MDDERNILNDLAVVVRQEIHDANDEPYSIPTARYMAAVLLVGLTNRGWRWASSEPRLNVYGDVDVTVDQVDDFLRLAAVARKVRQQRNAVGDGLQP